MLVYSMYLYFQSSSGRLFSFTVSGDVQGRILRNEPGLSLVPVQMKKTNEDVLKVYGMLRCQGAQSSETVWATASNPGVEHFIARGKSSPTQDSAGNLPEALLPPNGCWATTEPVDLSLMYMLPAACLRMILASSTTSLVINKREAIWSKESNISNR